MVCTVTTDEIWDVLAARVSESKPAPEGLINIFDIFSGAQLTLWEAEHYSELMAEVVALR